MPSMSEAIERADAAIDALGAVDLDALGPAERSRFVAATSRLGDRLDAARTRSIGAWDADRCWAGDGARSGQAWLRNLHHRSSSWAGREVRRARRLRHMPATTASFDAGRISADHVTVLATARNPRSAHLFERDESQLVGWAEALRFDHFERAVKYWLLHADPDGPDERARRQFENRSLVHSRTLSDTWHTDGTFDPVTGAEIDTALRHETDRLFREDWADARERLGAEPTVDDLGRTPQQRRADALTSLVRRGHAAGPDGAVAPPLLNILVGVETFSGMVCELFDGVVLTPGQVAERLAEVDVRTIEFDGPDRVARMSHRSRFFRGALRDAITIRDRECQHDVCDVVADRCDVDHVVPFPEGPTSEANGEALCDHHNGAKGRRRGRRSRSSWYRRLPPDDPDPPDPAPPGP